MFIFTCTETNTPFNIIRSPVSTFPHEGRTSPEHWCIFQVSHLTEAVIVYFYYYFYLLLL